MPHLDPAEFAMEAHLSYSRHPVEDMEPERDARESIADAAEWLGKVIEWLVEPRPTNHRTHGALYYDRQRVQMRAFALAYALKPEIFNGEPMEAVAKRIGVDSTTMTKHVRSFRDWSGIQTRSMGTRRNPVSPR